MIGRLIRWLWRHTSRTELMHTDFGAAYYGDREFCSSPTCTCWREKRVAPPLAIVRGRR